MIFTQIKRKYMVLSKRYYTSLTPTPLRWRGAKIFQIIAKDKPVISFIFVPLINSSNLLIDARYKVLFNYFDLQLAAGT
jgi:hypothetical protein